MGRKRTSESQNTEIDVLDGSIDPYEVLGVPKDADISTIKRAYYKLSLKEHPDKVTPELKKHAHEVFQKLTFAYAILSDEIRRQRYDKTGSTRETVFDDDDFDWLTYFKELSKQMVTKKTVEEFKISYQGSKEEENDLIESYIKGRGSMEYIFEHVMCSSLNDEDRFRQILDKKIQEGELKAYKAYKKDSNNTKEKRAKKAAREAAEADELSRELGIQGKLDGTEESLAALIRNKNKNRLDDLISGIEKKYTQPKNKKTKLSV